MKIEHINPTKPDDWAEWMESDNGTHVPLPLDPAQFDAAGVKAAREAVGMAKQDFFLDEIADGYADEAMARAAIAAYARAVGGGA